MLAAVGRDEFHAADIHQGGLDVVSGGVREEDAYDGGSITGQLAGGAVDAQGVVLTARGAKGEQEHGEGRLPLDDGSVLGVSRCRL